MITIAQYTKDFIVENMGVPADNITNVYNGTDTAKFKRTPEMAVEALKRYPCATPENAFVVGCIGSYEERKAQSLLLKAAKQLIDSGKLPNVHCLFVGEGPDRAMLEGMITELGLSENATLCDFTWRLWLSVRLVLKYWSKASVGLPTLDLRDDKLARGALSACAAPPPFARAARAQ